MIQTTDEQREKFRKAIAGKPLDKFFHNEGVWNYLVADVISNGGAFEHHVEELCGAEVVGDGLQAISPDVWFEAQPLPPRQGVSGKAEGNTVLDLALGCIGRRGDTASGIEYNFNEGQSWVCFAEGKMFSDCSSNTTHDPLRNQLTRVIENLLCFQARGAFPDHLCFVLITPRIFKENPRARQYGYKFDAYSDNPRELLDDINLCSIERRNDGNWQYPDLEQRLPQLRMSWVTYEDIFEDHFKINLPDLTTAHRSNARDVEPLVERLREIIDAPDDPE